MTVQPKAPGRLRCKRHGLVANRDGACRQCAVDDGPSGFRTAALLLGLAGVAGTVGWCLMRERPGEAAPEAIEATSADDDRVRLAPDFDRIRAQLGVVSVAPAEATEAEEGGPAEDLHLGQAIGGPNLGPNSGPNLASAAPPTPPRASVDPETRVADDPTDFELPLR